MQVHHANAPADDVYRCARENGDIAVTCANPDVRARQPENWLIQEVAEALLTPRNLRLIRHQIAEAGYSGKNLDTKDILETASDPLNHTAPDVAQQAQSTFANIIDHIEIHATEAVIRYSMDPVLALHFTQQISTASGGVGMDEFSGM